MIERLDVGGLPLGILPDAKYESASITLAPGDWLIIFTDGLVEAENAHQDEYGEARLLSVINSAASSTPGEMLTRMMAELDLFVGADSAARRRNLLAGKSGMRMRRKWSVVSDQ